MKLNGKNAVSTQANRSHEVEMQQRIDFETFKGFQIYRDSCLFIESTHICWVSSFNLDKIKSGKKCSSLSAKFQKPRDQRESS